MKRNLLIFSIIIIVLLVVGCLAQFEGNEQVLRTYTHNASSNVTITIFKGSHHNLSIMESNTSDIKVIESFYLKKSYVKDSNLFVRDYVKFNGNSTDLSINISSESSVDGWETKDANVHIDIYLPKNTNYTINNVSVGYFKGK